MEFVLEFVFDISSINMIWEQPVFHVRKYTPCFRVILECGVAVERRDRF
jgi:hypothetical protein